MENTEAQIPQGFETKSTSLAPVGPSAPSQQGYDRYQHAESIGEEILIERGRQIQVEGYTPEQDDSAYAHGELAWAAAAYSVCAGSEISFPGQGKYCPNVWPWNRQWFKPATARRMLIKAAALIVAQIEQIDRRTPLDAGKGLEAAQTFSTRPDRLADEARKDACDDHDNNRGQNES